MKKSVKELTWTEAIIKVLRSSFEPMRCGDILERIALEGYRSNITATPIRTVRSNIATSLQKEGSNSPYVKISRGFYTIRKGADDTGAHSQLTPNSAESDFPEELCDIITSFGMFWRRAEVCWTANPKILGMQRIGATPVNFFKQLGVYLLYDGREVIYVGRAAKGYLGRRLYEHTKDRLSARWDRFSWFGLLPVTEKGQIGELPDSYVAANFIPILEAILIEALEPRQNRKRGDDLSDVEYLQKTDPEIERKKIMEAVSRLK